MPVAALQLPLAIQVPWHTVVAVVGPAVEVAAFEASFAFEAVVEWLEIDIVAA